MTKINVPDSAAHVPPMATGVNKLNHPAALDLKAIRVRCGKGHTSLRHLAARASYCVDPLSDGGVAAARALADIPALITEVERLRSALAQSNGGDQ